MRKPMVGRRQALMALAGTLLASGLHAQAPASEDRQRLLAAQAATVGVSVRVVAGAGSASTLGRLREGSGVLVALPGAPEGLILTIGYLVLEAETVDLVTRENKRVPGQVVAYDFVNGLGLIRPLVPLGDVRPVALGSATSLDKGSPLLFVSGALPQQAGAVRLMDRRPFTGYWEYHLDAALYTSPPVGNHSGAGLFNAQGELVGVGNLAMLDVMPDEDPRQLPGNLFVPVDVLRPVLADLVRSGAHPQGRRPWLGVNAMQVGPRVRITRVTVGSPAESAGLRPGHWVTAVDGQAVLSLESFYKQVWAHGLGTGDIRLTIREGELERELRLPARERSEVVVRPRGI
jgi:S1-C subfamily serine protease